MSTGGRNLARRRLGFISVPERFLAAHDMTVKQSWQRTAPWRKQLLALVAFALICLGALSVVAHLTAARIARNERAWFAAQVNALVPAQLHDNDLLTDKTW